MNLEKYVHSICMHTDCSKTEKEELKEEMLDHLESLKQDYLNQGFSEEEALKKCISSFGDSAILGTLLQEAIYPLRKRLLIWLSIVLTAVTSSLYIMYAIELKEAVDTLYFFLLPALGLLLSSSFPAKKWNRKFLIGSLLVLVVLSTALNFMVSSQLNYNLIGTILYYSNFLVALSAIVLIYMTVLHQQHTSISTSGSQKRLHMINITSGITIGIACLFIAYSFLLFGASLLILLLISIPMSVWALLYYLQIKYKERLGKATHVLTFITALPVIFIIGYIAYMALSVIF
ncbi:permease prefix domain 1-containing protein [Bacillus sp. 1P06AnD]|uniref:permease prefix domain 1-containing protein n=1 Tax=Bacillus sp. 1P06AnD TaxID=3132208 RepID=UPI0039A28866